MRNDLRIGAGDLSQKLEAPGRGGSSSRGPSTPCDEGVTYGVSNGHLSGQRPMSLMQIEDQLHSVTGS
jgi:hypothetical protein